MINSKNTTLSICLAAGVFFAAAGCASMKKASLSFAGGAHVLEYGIDLWDTEEAVHPDVMRYIKSGRGDLSLDDTGFDPYLIGEQSLFITASDEENEVTEELSVLVQDTQAPVIELASERVVVAPGQEYKLTDNILSVKDPAEDDLFYLEMQQDEDGTCMLDTPFDGWGFYTVSAPDLDTDTEGEYTAQVIACDNNGNITEAEFVISVSASESAESQDSVIIQGTVDDPAETQEEAEKRFAEAQEYLCEKIGGTWDDACLFEPDHTGDEAEEASEEAPEQIDDAYEESEEEFVFDEEPDPEEEEYYEEPDPEAEEEVTEEEPEYEGDPEQDCYDMGGIWYPGDGCAWPDDSAE